LDDADWNFNLSFLAGFNQNPREYAANWYEGTVDLGDSQGVFRRLGDLDAAGISMAASTWYRPQHTLADYLTKPNVNRSQPNYAVKLNVGDSIEHNNFCYGETGFEM
jgi:hypothetical protein